MIFNGNAELPGRSVWGEYNVWQEDRRMHLRSLLGAWRRSNEFENIVAALNEPPPGRLLVSGLEGSQRNYLNAALYDHWSGPVLIVAHDSLRAEKVYEDLLTFLPEEEVKLLPPGRDFIIGEGCWGRAAKVGHSGWRRWSRWRRAGRWFSSPPPECHRLQNDAS